MTCKIDVKKWQIAVLVYHSDDMNNMLHAVLYPGIPSEKDLCSLKAELVKEMGWESIQDKLVYKQIASEEFLRNNGIQTEYGVI